MSSQNHRIGGVFVDDYVKLLVCYRLSRCNDSQIKNFLDAYSFSVASCFISRPVLDKIVDGKDVKNRLDKEVEQRMVYLIQDMPF